MSSGYDAVLTTQHHKPEDLDLRGYALAFVKPRVLTLMLMTATDILFTLLS